MCLPSTHPRGPRRCQGCGPESRRARRAANALYRNRLADAFEAGTRPDLAERTRAASFSAMSLLTEAAGFHPTDVAGLSGRVPGMAANRRVSQSDAELIADVGAALGTGASYDPDGDRVVFAEKKDDVDLTDATDAILLSARMSGRLRSLRDAPVDLPRDPNPVPTTWDPADLPADVARRRGTDQIARARDIDPEQDGADDHVREVIADADAFLRHSVTRPASDDVVGAPTSRVTRDQLWESSADNAAVVRAAEVAEDDYIAALESDLGDTVLMARQPRLVDHRQGAVYADMPVGAEDDPAFTAAVTSMSDDELGVACARATVATSRMYGTAEVLAAEHDTVYTGPVALRAERTGTYATALQREVRHRIAAGDDATTGALAGALARVAGEHAGQTKPGTADALRQINYYADNARHQRRRAPALAPQAVQYTDSEVEGLPLRSSKLAEYTEATAPKTPTRNRPGPRAFDPHFLREVELRGSD